MFDIAVSLIVPLVAGILLGLYLDNLTRQTYPVFFLLFVFLGVVIGLTNVYLKYFK